MCEQNKWLYEFSKRVVKLMLTIYVIHIFYADILLWIEDDLSSLGQITDDLTQVISICLGGYLFKAALENVFKIKGSNDYN